ncbi:hypothetical protein IFR05_005262 [Cadophora sp. M221]|nr:hypothetical protein IFR05_005262 [Cadophora sp. M221]
MSLAVLSNEILAEIINCLDGSLTGITLCSRQLHSIAEPILYSNIHLNCPKSYTNFIRTIVAKPYLVGYVRHFRTEVRVELILLLLFVVGHPYGWDYDLSFLSAKDRKWVRSQLPNSVHGKATCEKWFKKMFFKPNVNWVEVPMYWDAITAFLLTLFSPTLQTIQMDSYGPSSNHHPYNEYTYTEMVLEASTPTGGGPFHRLKEVTILPSGILPVHLIIPFLQVPSVTKFKASELKLIREPFKPALHTTDLTLTGCRLLGNQLMSFLLCFRSLKRLTYHHAAPRLSMLVASHLRRGLANSKGTLGELILIQELDDEWPGDDSASNSDESGFAGSGSSVASKQYVLGSLQTFEKLK